MRILLFMKSGMDSFLRHPDTDTLHLILQDVENESLSGEQPYNSNEP